MTVLFHLQIMTFNTCISYSFCTISFSFHLIDCIYTLFFLRKMISWIKFCARNKFTYIHFIKYCLEQLKENRKRSSWYSNSVMSFATKSQKKLIDYCRMMYYHQTRVSKTHRSGSRHDRLCWRWWWPLLN